MLAAAVLAGSLLPANAFARKAPADFTFVVANDLHYQDQRCGEWMRRVVEAFGRSNRGPGLLF